MQEYKFSKRILESTCLPILGLCKENIKLTVNTVGKNNIVLTGNTVMLHFCVMFSTWRGLWHFSFIAFSSTAFPLSCP